MDAVIKVGGSLQADSRFLRRACDFLTRISRKYRLLIVPGGGGFSRSVRELQSEYGFPDSLAHRLAILGMNAYGLALHSLIPDSTLTEDLKEKFEGCSILLPYKILEKCDELEPSWDVTSDSISAWVCSKIGCNKLLLLKMVDGISIMGELIKEIKAGDLRDIDQSVVDRKLPEILEKRGIMCWILNGKHPSRIEDVLEGRKTICTVVVPNQK